MSDIEFAQGLYFNEPDSKAPDFGLGKIAINKEKFLGWLERQSPNDKGYVRIDIKRSKKGEVYCALDTWVPKEPRGDSGPKPVGAVVDEFDDDIPF